MTHKGWDMRHSMLCLGEEEAGSVAEEEDAFREGAGNEASREAEARSGMLLLSEEHGTTLKTMQSTAARDRGVCV